MSNTESNFVRHEECPSCGSRNNLARYSDGHGYCFSPECGYFEPADADFSSVANGTQQRVMVTEMVGVIASIPERRISEQTCKKYNVRVEYDSKGVIDKHHYPFTDAETGEIVCTKVRRVEDKQFSINGTYTNKLGLFGQETCRGTGKYITITEGEVDCLSVSEMFDRKWDVVSLRSGAQSAAKEIKEQLEWLEGYENIVLCFDSDKAGQIAVDAVKDLFSPNKLKIAKLPLKDASEMLMANRIREFSQAWWDAKTHRPDGIIAGVDTWERILNSRKAKSIPYPWSGLNDLVKGIRPYELVTVTSGSGMGKSQLIRELEFFLFNTTKDNIGVIALEESIDRTALGIMSMAANKPLHEDEEADPETFKEYWDSTLGTDRFYLLEHFGSTAEDTLMSHVRYLTKALDCKWIILDHLAIVVSSQENGDERKNIDAIMTKLRTLVQELGVGLFLVSHLKRSGGLSHEEGGKISLSDLRGSQSIAQLSDIVIGMERDQQSDCEIVRNTTTIRVLKNRYTGLTGPACYLRYDRETGRMFETTKPEEASNDF